MADMCGKKANIYPNEKDETMDVLGSTDLSEEGSNTSQRKSKMTTKNLNENSEKIADISQTPSIPRSTNLYKTPKTEVSPIKKVRNCSRTKSRTDIYKKTSVFLTPCRKQNSSARKHGSKSPFSSLNTNLKHQKIIRHRPSPGGHKTGKGDSISTSSAPENVFSLVPLQATSLEEYCNINHQKNYAEYMKQFDFINRRRSFSPWESSLRYLEQSATSILPKRSTSKPFLLKRRTYSCGILSVNDSSFSDEKNSIKEELNDKLKHDSDNSDTFYSSENSDSFEDSKSCDVENGESVAEDASVLRVQQPLRVKYIDETSMVTRELIIYSNKFLERIYKEKGKALSKSEIFENIVKESADYKGEQLRVIRDTDEFLSSLKNAAKRHPRAKLSKLARNHSPQKSNRNVTKPPRRIHSAPCWIRWWGKTEDKVGMNEWKMPDINLPPQYHSSATNDYLFTKNKKRQSKNNVDCSDSFTKDNERNELCVKSRTSLKRVNCEGIISSIFRFYFQHYSKLGGRLKSGAVISRTNSHFWLKRCGVILDDATFKIANDCFTAVAKSKIVLNISDYMQYLIAIARTRRIFTMDIVRKLMSVSIDSPLVMKMHDELEKSNSLKRPIVWQQKKT